MKIVCLPLVAALLCAPPAQTLQKKSVDGMVVGDAPPTPQDRVNQAWRQLQDSFGSKRVDVRIQAINALSLLGGNVRAEDMVRSAMSDSAADIDVRMAAIVAAGQMDKNRGARPVFREELHRLLASDDPKLSFTAAATLWAANDPSGQEVLTATAEGERVSDYSFMKRSERNADRTLHSPSALARIAVMQSLTILVPPVGMGMGVYGYLKGAPESSPQVTAIVQLGKVHTPEVEKALIEATKTKDPAARIAAAEALSTFSGPAVHDALSTLLDDDKLQVRLTASAAFLKVGEAKPDRETRRKR